MMKPRSSASATNVVDDPCWGDPQHCSLEHLLTLVSRTKSILHETKSYLVFHKPADLRMDGPYPSTVHKLLTYWYPPPSLKPLSSSELLAQLKHLHKHSDIPDNELRPCHQLDYATSGVLLVARTGNAAAWASACFESRHVQKTYMAVLHGHVTPLDLSKVNANSSDTDNNLSSSSSSTSSLSQICPERLAKIVQEEELQYRRTQHKKRPETFMGFQPPNAFLQIFQGRYARKKKLSKKRRRERLSPEQWERVEQELQLNDNEQAIVAKTPWKTLKHNDQLRAAIERATEQYNFYLKDILQEEDEAKRETNGDSSGSNEPLPTVFQTQGDDDRTFYVYIALAQVGEEFAMRIPNSYSHEWLSSGEESMNFKAALTKCTIVSRGYLQGEPVTKVQLEPRTGRRHQLRVHTAWIGHPIVGDQTYEKPHKDNSGSTKTHLSSRMCLHAFALGFPLPAHEDAINPNLPETLGDLLQTSAPDPFSVHPEDSTFTVASM